MSDKTIIQTDPESNLKKTGFHPKLMPVVIVILLFVPLFFINPGQKQADKVKNNTVNSASSSSISSSSQSSTGSSNSGLFGFNWTWPSINLPIIGQNQSTIAATTSSSLQPTEISNFNGLGNLFRPAESTNTSSNPDLTNQITSPDLAAMRRSDLNPAEPELLSGKVVFDSNSEFSVMSDKFLPGETVEVNYGDRKTRVTIQRSKILQSDVYLAVDKQIFESLGGNLDDNKTIEVTMIKI